MIIFHLDDLLYKNNKMSQNALVKLTGIRPGTISEIYNNLIQRVNLDHLNAICEVLNCDISDLMEYIPDKKPKK